MYLFAAIFVCCLRASTAHINVAESDQLFHGISQFNLNSAGDVGDLYHV